MTTRVVVEPVYDIVVNVEEKDAATGEWHHVEKIDVPKSSERWEYYIYSTRRLTIEEKT